MRKKKKFSVVMRKLKRKQLKIRTIKISPLLSQNTLPRRIPLPPIPIKTKSLSTLSPGKISISLSPEKDKDSTISDEAKKETVKLKISDENILVET